MVAGGGRQHGEKRPGPNAPGPGDLHPPHQADPAQPHGLHEVTMGGTHPIPIDSLGRNPLPFPPFHGFIDPQHQRPGGRGQQAHQQAQQHPADRQRGPHRPTEHMVVPGEIPLLMQTQHLQSRRHGALAGRQNGPHQQHLGLPPGTRIEEDSKRLQQEYNRGRQRWHVVEPLSWVPSCYPAFPQNPPSHFVQSRAKACLLRTCSLVAH